MRKQMHLIVIILAVLFTSQISFGQEKKTDIIKIKTSAQCGECKDRIEKALAYEKGVVKSELDLETKVITVEYKVKSTDPGKIRKAIAKTGYDADEENADEKAYQKLPKCCQKGGHE